MDPPPPQAITSKTAAPTKAQRIGCVRYLNAKPLIEGLEGLADPVVSLDVPSALILDLERGGVDIALCPVIDYYRCKQPLVIVPVGCIASDGPTQTVRLFSRVPIASITQIHADTDSHTSVALLRVLLHELHGVQPGMVAFDARKTASEAASAGGNGETGGTKGSGNGLGDRPQAMLLIGDKVASHAPSARDYPHQLDLGEAWKQLTGLPFVFAIWMAHRDTELAGLPERLDRQRQKNTQQIQAIAKRHAAAHGWDIHQACDYLGRVLSYRVGDGYLKAIERFAGYAAGMGLIGSARALEIWRGGNQPVDRRDRPDT